MINEQKKMDIERELFASLKPVYPSQRFVSELQGRLTHKPRTSIEQHNKLFAVLITCMGLVFGVTLLWIFRKTI